VSFYAASLFADVSGAIYKIASIESDSGTFIQMKTLSDVGVTLTSSGEFEFKNAN
jgi:hypothetical protein